MPRNRVKKLEGAGLLHPQRDFLGRRRFDPTELDAVKQRSTPAKAAPPARARHAIAGATAARAFRMFGEKKSLREVVLELEVAPDDALDLRRRYADFGADMLVAAAELEKLRELLDWQGETAASLVVAVNQRLRRQYLRGREEAAQKSADEDEHSQLKGRVNGEREKVYSGS